MPKFSRGKTSKIESLEDHDNLKEGDEIVENKSVTHYTFTLEFQFLSSVLHIEFNFRTRNIFFKVRGVGYRKIIFLPLNYGH